MSHNLGQCLDPWRREVCVECEYSRLVFPSVLTLRCKFLFSRNYFVEETWDMVVDNNLLLTARDRDVLVSEIRRKGKYIFECIGFAKRKSSETFNSDHI